MNVSQLIARLQRFPPETRVVVNMARNELANGKECGNASLEPAIGSGEPGCVWNRDYYPLLTDESERQEDVVNIAP